MAIREISSRFRPRKWFLMPPPTSQKWCAFSELSWSSQSTITPFHTLSKANSRTKASYYHLIRRRSTVCTLGHVWSRRVREINCWYKSLYPRSRLRKNNKHLSHMRGRSERSTNPSPSYSVKCCSPRISKCYAQMRISTTGPLRPHQLVSLKDTSDPSALWFEEILAQVWAIQ